MADFSFNLPHHVAVRQTYTGILYKTQVTNFAESWSG